MSNNLGLWNQMMILQSFFDAANYAMNWLNKLFETD